MEDDIDGFDCGLPVVNNWLRNQLKNAGRQHTAVAYATFSNGVLAGFYTLSAYGINHTEANGWLKKKQSRPNPGDTLGHAWRRHTLPNHAHRFSTAKGRDLARFQCG